MTRKDFLYMQIKAMLDDRLYDLVDAFASATMNDEQYDKFCADEDIEEVETEAMEIAMDEILGAIHATLRV